MEQEPCTKFSGVLISFHKVMKFSIQHRWHHTQERKYFTPAFLCISLVDFIKKEPNTKFQSVFDHFLQTYEVMKFWMVRLCLDPSDVMYANEHTLHANYGLYVKGWNFRLMPFCFMTKKGSFESNVVTFITGPLHETLLTVTDFVLCECELATVML